MNAGEISKNHWTQDMGIGGGRIIGEACHYIDLISFFTSCNVKSVLLSANGMHPKEDTDNATILLKYENGSIGVINYYSNGHKSYPKERIEVYQSGNNLVIHNFKKIEFHGFRFKNFKKYQDKGHHNQFEKWYKFLKLGGDEIITYESIYNTSKTAICALESLKTNSWVDV